MLSRQGSIALRRLPPSLFAPTICVDGIGIVTAYGVGVRANRERSSRGASALAPVRLFSAPGQFMGSVELDGTLDDRLPAPGANPTALDDVNAAAARCLTLARLAAREALHDAPDAPDPLALVFATNVEDRGRSHAELAEALAEELGIRGMRLGVSVACASATLALSVAAERLRDGDVRRALVVGADLITPRVLEGFRLLGLLAEGPCLPFSERMGTTLGEGAAALLLRAVEPSDADEDPRDLPPSTALLGWGSSNDAHHPTQPHPRGRGTCEAVQQALAMSGVDGSTLGHINAHATGTAANDDAEWCGLTRAVGCEERTVVALKGQVGHTQGAAGLVEAALSLIAVDDGGSLPASTPIETRRAGGPTRVSGVGDRQDAAAPWLCVNSGFGGSNAAVLFGPARRVPAAAPRRVYICGGASVGPWGRRDWGEACPRPDERHGPRCRIDARRALRGVDLREADRSSESLLVALHDALRSAGLRRAPGWGLAAAQVRVSPDRLQRLASGNGPPATNFTRSFLGHPASFAAMTLDLSGPFSVHTEPGFGALVALTHALSNLRRASSDAGGFMVAAVDEPDHLDPAPRVHAPGFDGSAAICLSHSGAVEILCAQLGAPGELESTRARALRAALALAGASEDRADAPLEWHALGSSSALAVSHQLIDVMHLVRESGNADAGNDQGGFGPLVGVQAESDAMSWAAVFRRVFDGPEGP